MIESITSSSEHFSSITTVQVKTDKFIDTFEFDPDAIDMIKAAGAAIHHFECHGSPPLASDETAAFVALYTFGALFPWKVMSNAISAVSDHS